jgi:1-acyl-sn-glycerol-3-phosphate acyltransferase
MTKIRSFFGLAELFFRLVFSMIHNYRYLNEDLENNFMVCKKICRNVVKSAHINLKIQGQKKIPTDKPFMLVPNHRCFFDVVFLLAALDCPVSFVAAKELWNYPVLRKYLSAIYCIPLDRYTKDLARMKNNISQIQDALSKHNLVMFPEGECSYDREEMREFKKGGFMGVLGMDINIVPAFIKIGEFRHIGRKWMIPRGDVSICVGDSFQVHEVSDKRVQASELASYAQECVRRLQEEA